jgi:hypothetical protein
MTTPRLLASLSITSLLFAACAGGGGGTGAASGAPSAASTGTPAAASAPAASGGMEGSVEVRLDELNDSGVSGTATLTDLGNGMLRVEIDVEAAGNAAMPAHIHPGTCDELDPAPQYPLSDVEDGASTTEVEASLADVQTGEFAINLHESAETAETYTACGDIPAA